MDNIAALLSSLQGPYLIPAVIILLALLFFLGANTLLRKVVASTGSLLKGIIVPYELMAWPFRLLVIHIALSALLHSISITAESREIFRHTLRITAVLAVSWFVMRLLRVFEHFILQHYAGNVRENESARKIFTHVSLARKILNVLIVLLSVAGVLMTFDTVRQVGLSILASAGIAGVILGFAAQKSLATLVAGIQIAITQPMRSYLLTGSLTVLFRTGVEHHQSFLVLFYFLWIILFLPKPFAVNLSVLLL
jgi:small-conductance mechanosensitive channel